MYIIRFHCCSTSNMLYKRVITCMSFKLLNYKILHKNNYYDLQNSLQDIVIVITCCWQFCAKKFLAVVIVNNYSTTTNLIRQMLSCCSLLTCNSIAKINTYLYLFSWRLSSYIYNSYVVAT